MDRNSHIDFLKGLGIILVVWGHIPGCPIVEYIYSFHMPLFIFISGYLHRQKGSINEYVQNKCNKLLVPFYFFSILFWAIYLAILYVTNASNVKEQLFKVIYIALGSGQNAIDYFNKGNVVLWYLPCLFFISTFYFVIRKRLKIEKLVPFIIFLISLLGLICISYGVSLPFSLDTAFVLLPFYYLGDRFKILIPKLVATPLLSIVTIGFLCAVHYVAFKLNTDFFSSVDVSSGKIGNYFLFYLSAFAGVVWLFVLSLTISRSSSFNYLGRKSLVILVIHLPITQLLTSILPISENYLFYSLLIVATSVLFCMPFIALFERYLLFAIGGSDMVQLKFLWLKKERRF